MTSDKLKTAVKVVLPLIIALISIFVVARFMSSVDFHKDTIIYLDEKKATVMELTASSTAASAAITLIPGDAGTPIAEKLADMSSYFLVVLCAVYLEKYLVTIMSYVAFAFLIPAGCILFSLNALRKSRLYMYFAVKLILIGIVIASVIPLSVKVSKIIEDTYEVSINETIESAKESTAELEKDKEEEKGVFSKFVNSVKDGVSNATKEMEQVLNRFIEALAVMLVTSCLIPVVVILFLVWLMKTVLGVRIDVSRMPSTTRITSLSKRDE